MECCALFNSLPWNASASAINIDTQKGWSQKEVRTYPDCQMLLLTVEISNCLISAGLLICRVTGQKATFHTCASSPECTNVSFVEVDEVAMQCCRSEMVIS